MFWTAMTRMKIHDGGDLVDEHHLLDVGVQRRGLAVVVVLGGVGLVVVGGWGVRNSAFVGRALEGGAGAGSGGGLGFSSLGAGEGNGARVGVEAGVAVGGGALPFLLRAVRIIAIREGAIGGGARWDRGRLRGISHGGVRGAAVRARTVWWARCGAAGGRRAERRTARSRRA